MIALWRLLPIWGQIGSILGFLALLGGGVAYVHHSIYQAGYSACQSDIRDADNKRKAEAQVNITKIGEKYGKIRRDLPKAGYNAPLSPISAAAIDRLRDKSHAAPVRSRWSMRHP